MDFIVKNDFNLIERKEWDSYISQCKYSHFFQKYDWGQFQKSNSNRTPLYFKMLDRNKISAAGLILRKHLPLTPFSIYEIPCGPCANDIENIINALEWVENTFCKSSVLINISPRVSLAEESLLQPTLENFGYDRDIEGNRFNRYHDETISIDLSKDLPSIFSSFRKSTKWEIKRQEKNGVQILISNSLQSLSIFYDLYQKHSPKRGGFFHSKRYFNFLHSSYLKNPDNGFIALGSHQNDVTSAAIFLRTFNRIWYTFGASKLTKEKEFPTSHLLHWQVIKHAKEVGCLTYDFGGVAKEAEPTSPLYGVLLFKTGFSKNFTRFIPPYKKTHMPFLSKVIKGYHQLSS